MKYIYNFLTVVITLLPLTRCSDTTSKENNSGKLNDLNKYGQYNMKKFGSLTLNDNDKKNKNKYTKDINEIIRLLENNKNKLLNSQKNELKTVLNVLNKIQNKDIRETYNDVNNPEFLIYLCSTIYILPKEKKELLLNIIMNNYNPDWDVNLGSFTPLINLIYNEDLDDIKILIEIGNASINILCGNQSGSNTPMRAALEEGNDEVIQYLIQKGGEVNIPNHGMFTGLYLLDSSNYANNMYHESDEKKIRLNTNPNPKYIQDLFYFNGVRIPNDQLEILQDRYNYHKNDKSVGNDYSSYLIKLNPTGLIEYMKAGRLYLQNKHINPVPQIYTIFNDIPEKN